MQLGGSSDAEDMIMENVYDVLLDCFQTIIITIVTRAAKMGSSIAAFWTATLKEMSLDINITLTANLAAGAHLATTSFARNRAYTVVPGAC